MSVSRPRRLRQALAWLALLAVVSFVALDAVHQHRDLAGTPHSRCELCVTLHAAALGTAVVTLPFSSSTQPLAAKVEASVVPQSSPTNFYIRPPPAA